MPKPTQPVVHAFTGKQWRILVVLASCNCISAVVQSLQAPFYPAEAEKKGVRPTEYGFVFGFYALIGFLACPVVSAMFHRFRPSTAFCIGYLTVGTTAVCFGLLDNINDHTAFLGLSVLLRLFEAFGGATVFIANYTFVTIAFPNSIATAFAVLETAFQVGLAAGPVYGGILFQIGGDNFGFTLPFLVSGCLGFISNIIAVSVLKDIAPSSEPGSNGSQIKTTSNRSSQNSGFFTLLKFPTIVLYAFSVFATSLSAGFLSSTLEPHLRQFSLTPVAIGLMFLINSGVYAVMVSGWGAICDRTLHPEYIILTGTLLILASFSTVGPLNFLPILPSLALTGVSLALFGLGNGAVSVSAFLLLLIEAKRNGYPDTVDTNATVTSLWLAFLKLGASVGPSLGGLLLDEFGFRTATDFIVGFFVTVAMLLLVSMILSKRGENSNAENATGEQRSLVLSKPNGNGSTYEATKDIGYQSS